MKSRTTQFPGRAENLPPKHYWYKSSLDPGAYGLRTNMRRAKKISAG